MLKNERLNLLPRLDKEFDLAAFSFGQGMAELAARKAESETNSPAAKGKDKKSTVEDFDWVDRLEATAPSTAIGDAIRDVMNRKRGQPLAGMVLVTDGVNNAGSQPRDAAALARQEGVPLYIYGVGITSPRDIILQNLFAPDVTFVKDEVPVTVRVRGQGLNGETAELQLKLGDQTVATKDRHFRQRRRASRADEVHTAESRRVRSHRQHRGASGRDGEGQQFAHTTAQGHRREDQSLLVDQSPRWEFLQVSVCWIYQPTSVQGEMQRQPTCTSITITITISWRP